MERDLALEDLCRQLLRNVGVRGLRVSVFWNFRLRTTVGFAYMAERRIVLNPQLLVVAPRQVQVTLKHELAHVLSFHRAGRKIISPHGPEWREACEDLGIPDEPVTHNIPFPRKRLKRKFFYACKGCGTVLARVRPAVNRLACLRCCKKFNGGAYAERYRFLKKAAQQNLTSCMSEEIQSITIPDALVKVYDEIIATMPSDFVLEDSLMNRAGSGFALGVARKRIGIFKSRIGMVAHFEFSRQDMSPLDVMRGRPNSFNLIVLAAHDRIPVPQPDGSTVEQDAEQLFKVLYLSAKEMIAAFAVMNRLMREEGWA